MKLNSIRFDINEGITIHCEKLGEKDFKSLRYAMVDYDISLINEPLRGVKEQSRIYKKNIQFQEQYFILFFPLDNIISPYESQVRFKSITFFMGGNKKFGFKINKTFSFKELQKNGSGKSIKTTPIRETYRENLQKGRLSSQMKRPSAQFNNPSSKKVEETKLFVDSLKKFKSEIQGSNFEKLIKKKGKILQSSLKSFCISLLCNLLLVTKYVNNLVGNDTQGDLTEFVKMELINEKISEVLT